MQPKFALIGAAGYIAPRHVKAIQDIGGSLRAVLDPSDSLGYLDRFDFNTEVFHETSDITQYLESNPVDYISIAVPNHLHVPFCTWAMKRGADVICEKPLALFPVDLDTMQAVENQTIHRVYTILQLRLHPALIALKQSLKDKPVDVILTYTTPRGKWYQKSWKSELNKSGGIFFNIGIHMFDMLCWLFGKPVQSHVTQNDGETAAGITQFKNCNARWFLSTSPKFQSKRSITINDQTIDFTTGFTDLHTEVYRKIIVGNGFTIEDARPAIELAYSLSQTEPGNDYNEIVES